MTAVLRVAPALLLVACATAGRTPEGAERRARAAGGHRGPITAVEIAESNVASAYDAVVRLRGNFLSMRGINSLAHSVRSSRPVVFVDGMEVGALFELRSIPAQDVSEIRFLSSSEATLRYGDGYMAGIIHVTTKR